jgi:hypothetical protein
MNTNGNELSETQNMALNGTFILHHWVLRHVALKSVRAELDSVGKVGKD